MNISKPEYWVCVSPDYGFSLGIISRLRDIAKNGDVAVGAVAFLEDSQQGELFQAGAEKIYCIHKMQDDEGIARQIAVLCEEFHPQIVLFPATIAMRSIAALVAARLGCGLCADCTAISLRDDGVLIQTRPTFADCLIADIITERARPQMATIRPGIYMPVLRPGSGTRVIPAKQIDRSTEKLVTILEEYQLEQNPLIDAKIIVAGGKGIGTRGFAKLFELARLIGASVGASRGAVAAGYIPYFYQIGLTGVTVRPDIYLAFGISGAIQHIVGMANAAYIAAINTDNKAAIFDYSDLAIVAPFEEIADKMIRIFQKKP